MNRKRSQKSLNSNKRSQVFDKQLKNKSKNSDRNKERSSLNNGKKI